MIDRVGAVLSGAVNTNAGYIETRELASILAKVGMISFLRN